MACARAARLSHSRQDSRNIGVITQFAGMPTVYQHHLPTQVWVRTRFLRKRDLAAARALGSRPLTGRWVVIKLLKRWNFFLLSE